jgi:hypothetical protein
MSKFNLPRYLGASFAAMVILSQSAMAEMVRLQWDASPDGSVTQYRIYGSSSDADAFSPIVETSELEAHIEVPGSALGYRFHVTALDAEGVESDPSNAVVVGPVLVRRGVYGVGFSLSWSGTGFALESAPDVQGPWTVLSTTSPALIATTEPAQFFRLVKN